MTGPHDRTTHVPTCVCGHHARRHEIPGFDGECIADGCGCRAFTPREITTGSAGPVTLGAHRQAAPSGTTVAQLVAAGKQSSHKRTVAIAERVETYARDLAARLRAERDLALVQERAAADKATLDAVIPAVAPLPSDSSSAGRTVTPEPATCEDCGETFRSGHAKGAHRRHAHPRAAAS